MSIYTHKYRIRTKAMGYLVSLLSWLSAALLTSGPGFKLARGEIPFFYERNFIATTFPYHSPIVPI